MRRLLIPTLLAATLVLAGCGQTAAGPTPTPTAATPSSTPTPAATPAETSAPEPGATPIDLGCEQVLTPQQMYDYNSIYSAVSFTPDAGTTAAAAVAMQGVACRWVNTSSGATIDVSVAQPAPSQLADLPSRADDPAPYGFFAGGVAQAFPGAYWVTVASGDFIAAEDAAPLVGAVVGNLP